MIYDRKLSTSYLIVLHRAVQHTWKASISSLKYIQVVTPSRSPSSAFFTLLQGFASDIVRYVAFFSYFTIQLVQLFLCCFADRPPEGKTISEKVGPAERIEKEHRPCGFFKAVVKTLFPFGENIMSHVVPSALAPTITSFLASCASRANMCVLLYTINVTSRQRDIIRARLY